jgi:hypothetical protein
LKDRWQDLFGATFDVLLYDLTSTYFESDPPFEEEDKRRFGYSRDHRFDCVQVVIALIVTPEGLRFKRYWARLKELQRQRPAYSTLLMKLAAMQLLDVHFPTTDGRELVFTATLLSSARHLGKRRQWPVRASGHVDLDRTVPMIC